MYSARSYHLGGGTEEVTFKFPLGRGGQVRHEGRDILRKESNLHEDLGSEKWHVGETKLKSGWLNLQLRSRAFAQNALIWFNLQHSKRKAKISR